MSVWLWCTFWHTGSSFRQVTALFPLTNWLQRLRKNVHNNTAKNSCNTIRGSHNSSDAVYWKSRDKPIQENTKHPCKLYSGKQMRHSADQLATANSPDLLDTAADDPINCSKSASSTARLNLSIARAADTRSNQTTLPMHLYMSTAVWHYVT